MTSHPEMSASLVAARRPVLAAGRLLLAGLMLASLVIGAIDLSLQDVLILNRDSASVQLLLESRLPRTLALLLAGAALAIAGLIMQIITRNRFVEPSTAGTVESASLGLLLATLIAPTLPVLGKTLVAAASALAGTGLFLLLLRRVRLASVLTVPLIGLMLSGVIEAVALFIANRHGLLQALYAWSSGDFSSVLAGRYELLWGAALLGVAAWLLADRFSVAGLGEAMATNLGLAYLPTITLGLVIVAMITAVTVTTVGIIPFLGLVVPNVVSALMGDNIRRSIPWVAFTGAGFVLFCDVLGRLVRYPYEIPAGTVCGVLGCLVFLYLLLRREVRNG